MIKNARKRYVKLVFVGYAPADLACELHLVGKNWEVNVVGDEMKPYTECKKKYELLEKEVEA